MLLFNSIDDKVRQECLFPRVDEIPDDDGSSSPMSSDFEDAQFGVETAMEIENQMPSFSEDINVQIIPDDDQPEHRFVEKCPDTMDLPLIDSIVHQMATSHLYSQEEIDEAHPPGS